MTRSGRLALALACVLVCACTSARPSQPPSATPPPSATWAEPARPPAAPPPPQTLPARQPYILETGWCMPSVSRIGKKDPKTFDRCSMDTRQPVLIGATEQVSIDLDTFGGRVKVYCALFSPSGAFLMASLDDTGSGHVTCFLR